LADVLEVAEALARAGGVEKSELKRIRKAKRDRRGGFEEGVVLVETSPQESGSAGGERGLFQEEAREGRIVEAARLPRLEEAQAGPFDVRKGNDFVELVQSSTVDLAAPEWVIRSPRRIGAAPTQVGGSVQWSLEGKRVGARLYLRLKVLIGTRQLSLPLGPADDQGGK
jgi:hypothetical protein